RRSSGHGHSVTKPSSSSMRIVVSLIAEYLPNHVDRGARPAAVSRAAQSAHPRLLARCPCLLGRPLGLVERADLPQRRPQPFDLRAELLEQCRRSTAGSCRPPPVLPCLHTRMAPPRTEPVR